MGYNLVPEPPAKTIPFITKRLFSHKCTTFPSIKLQITHKRPLSEKIEAPNDNRYLSKYTLRSFNTFTGTYLTAGRLTHSSVEMILMVIESVLIVSKSIPSIRVPRLSFISIAPAFITTMSAKIRIKPALIRIIRILI